MKNTTRIIGSEVRNHCQTSYNIALPMDRQFMREETKEEKKTRRKIRRR
jgi:hypothetical protein